MTAALTLFLVLHGLVHLSIWVPKPKPDGAPPPFEPDHSALLTATAVPKASAHTLSVTLAIATTVAYVAAGIALALDVGAVVPLAVAAAAAGLVLKLVFFHPWLILGILLDVAVLTAATSGWPVDLS